MSTPRPSFPEWLHQVAQLQAAHFGIRLADTTERYDYLRLYNAGHSPEYAAARGVMA